MTLPGAVGSGATFCIWSVMTSPHVRAPWQHGGVPSLDSVALVSLEPWDDVWRRNQHIAARVVRHGHVKRLTFIEPPRPRPEAARCPEPGIRVVTPRRLVRPRLGGLVAAGFGARRWTRAVDVLWINDAPVGLHALHRGQRAVYDVTDDWREASASPAGRRRQIRAEDRLAGRATTIVCSGVLQERWRQRYDVQALLVSNGVDLRSAEGAAPVQLDGRAPHIGYLGTLHSDRLDLDAVVRMAAQPEVGTLHLVGPDALDPSARARLLSAGVRVHGPVPADQVPRWLKAMDVLVCPHRVTSFTMSLDAIKSHEYLASGRPVVATPTSGFQDVRADGVWVTGDVQPAIKAALAGPREYGTRGTADWDERADAFATVLHEVARRP